MKMEDPPATFKLMAAKQMPARFKDTVSKNK